MQRPDLVVRGVKLTDGETTFHVLDRRNIIGETWVQIHNPDPNVGEDPTSARWFQLSDAPGTIGELRLAGRWQR